MSTDYSINFTNNALKKIQSLLEQEKDNRSSVLRVAVSGGGCSGFKYNFLLDQVNESLSLNDESDDDYDDEFDNEDDDEESDDYRRDTGFSRKGRDIVINDKDGNPLLMVDNFSIEFLKNSIIDYTEDLYGSSFQVKNPSAKSRCGCGNSFSV